MMAALPTSIGKFRIEGVLGRGAMGVVFRAHDPDIERTVAIKLVRTDLLEGDDRAHYIARFRNEAKMVGRCIHPNIVGIHDFALHEGSPFLVLEYVDGKDLRRTLQRGARVDLATTGHVALKVLEALAYAHGFGVIHRDIKPANILLTASASIKVTDFGISRALASSSTLSSVLVGTPCYMSPEQCLGDRIDTRSDLFSLGCVLYEMLSGEQAFAGANYVATTHRILNERPRPLGELRPDLPEAVLAVVDAALAKKPDDRFQGAAAMADALRAALSAAGMFELRDDDATAVLGLKESAPSSRAHHVERLSVASLATLERRLAFHLGPMARIHLRRSVLTARTPDELADSLVSLVPPFAARAQLRTELLTVINGDSGATLDGLDASGFMTARSERSLIELDTITKALIQVIGPIAPRLLQRALRTATTPDELEAISVKLIESPRGREEFRKLLSRPARK